jgi:hypothetical protein
VFVVVDLKYMTETRDPKVSKPILMEFFPLKIPYKIFCGFREEDQKQITTRVVGHNFERNSPKDHPCKIWFNLVQWFLRKRFNLNGRRQRT